MIDRRHARRRPALAGVPIAWIWAGMVVIGELARLRYIERRRCVSAPQPRLLRALVPWREYWARAGKERWPLQPRIRAEEKLGCMITSCKVYACWRCPGCVVCWDTSVVGSLRRGLAGTTTYNGPWSSSTVLYKDVWRGRRQLRHSWSRSVDAPAGPQTSRRQGLQILRGGSVRP